MPTMTDALTEAFSRNIVLNVFRNSIWLSAFTRGWEPDAQDNYTVHIPSLVVPDSAVGAATRAELAKAPAYASPSTTLQDLVMDQHVRGAVEVERLDALENSLKNGEYVRRVSEQVGHALALNIDENLATAVTGTAFKAGQKLAVAGPIKVANPMSQNVEKVREALMLGLLYFTRANLISRNFTVGPGELSPVYWIAPPELNAAFVQDIVDSGWSDFRTAAASDAITSAGILSNTAWEGRFANVDILSTTSLPNAVGAGGYKAYMGITNAWAAALRGIENDVAGFGDGSTGGAYVDRFTSVGTFGRKQLNPDWIIEITISSVA